MTFPLQIYSTIRYIFPSSWSLGTESDYLYQTWNGTTTFLCSALATSVWAIGSSTHSTTGSSARIILMWDIFCVSSLLFSSSSPTCIIIKQIVICLGQICRLRGPEEGFDGRDEEPGGVCGHFSDCRPADGSRQTLLLRFDEGTLKIRADRLKSHSHAACKRSEETGYSKGLLKIYPPTSPSTIHSNERDR